MKKLLIKKGPFFTVVIIGLFTLFYEFGEKSLHYRGSRHVMTEESQKIRIWNRKTQSYFNEKVPAAGILKMLYSGEDNVGSVIRKVARIPFLSHFFGFLQKLPLTKRAIEPFREKYNVSLEDCESVDFNSFNDFFIRRLKKEARPIATSELIAPVDGRYLCFEDLSLIDGIYAKGQKLSLSELLQDEVLAEMYADGSLVIARLAPVDYHRMHMPVNGAPSIARKIFGKLDSVNPLAMRKQIEIYTQNKRIIVEIETEELGKVLYIPIGATYVGSIHLYYTPESTLAKGDEIGLFEFGGSTVILLFEPGKIKFESDVLEQTKIGYETYLQMGESLGDLSK